MKTCSRNTYILHLILRQSRTLMNLPFHLTQYQSCIRKAPGDLLSRTFLDIQSESLPEIIRFVTSRTIGQMLRDDVYTKTVIYNHRLDEAVDRTYIRFDSRIICLCYWHEATTSTSFITCSNLTHVRVLVKRFSSHNLAASFEK